MNLTSASYFLDDAATVRLRLTFRRALGTYSVELWQDERMVAAHSSTEWFDTAAALIATVEGFLRANSVRALTDDERGELQRGLYRQARRPA